MIRLTQMNFKVRPEEDGSYIVFHKASARYETMDFTTEFGWNTTRFDDGSTLSESAIPDSEMARWYAYWLKPYRISSNYWFDEIETMLDEVKADLKQYDERRLTDDEAERCDNLEELRDLLEQAKDFAEVLR